MVAEGEKGRGRCWGSSRATTQFYPTGSVVMLEPGSGVKTQSNERRGMACLVVLVSRESPVKMGTRDESEPSDQLRPVGEKRANRVALSHCRGSQQCASAAGANSRCQFCSPTLYSSVPVLEHCRGTEALFDGWRTISGADCLVADARLW